MFPPENCFRVKHYRNRSGNKSLPGTAGWITIQPPMEKKVKNKLFEIFLPARIDNINRGSRIPVYIFTIYAIVSTIRSLIHIFSADGGAGSIAGMDLSVKGADGIIFAFALWGSSQLLLAIIQLLVVFRYKSLVPFMYFLLMIEVLLREMIGKMKPVLFSHTPPGAIGNQIILPLAAFMLIFSLWSALKKQKEA